MKNIIIENCMKSFNDDYNIYEKKEEVLFEHFSNYCVIGKFCQEAYQEDPTFYEDVHTGKGGDYSVDGVLILINDQPVVNIEQLNDITAKKWRVKLIFIQAKTSPNFESGQMLKTGKGVLDILKFDKSRANEKLSLYIDIIEQIYGRSEKFVVNPSCSIFYVTTGLWTADENLRSVKLQIENDIRNLHLTDTVEFIPIDNDRLIQMYREITQSITKTIQMMKAVPFPEIQGVDEAYVGLITIQELINLITDEGGLLQNNIFYENVRGFLGYNPVNTEIRDTLLSTEKVFRFPILNNGVTIVTKELKHVGDKFTLSNFQIVNGCQTCNVIYNCKEKQIGTAYCALKIICTEDTDIITEVIKSTNKQTVVLDEAFESLRKIHKSIQDYFEAVEPENRLYYERRSKEFDNTYDINRHRVVTLTTLINAYVAMYLEEPHSTHRYYGELLKAYKDKLFNETDNPILYYTAAWCLYKVDYILASDSIFSTLRKYRYHLILLISHLAATRPRPFYSSSRDAERYCKAICAKINDDSEFKTLMLTAAGILTQVLKAMPAYQNTNELLRRKEFTLALLSELNNSKNK